MQWGAGLRLFAYQPDKKRDHKQQDKNEEKDLGDLDGTGRDAGKAEQRGDQRDHEKYGGIIQRFLFLSSKDGQPEALASDQPSDQQQS